MENLIKLLNRRELTEEDGILICKTIGRLFNFIGCYSERSSEIYQSLNEDGKRNFMLAICMSAMELRDSFDPESTCIDDRKIASQTFAANNMEWFKKTFQDQSGFALPLKRDSSTFFTYANRKELKDRGCGWLLGYLLCWETEHPTIKQSFFGGVVRGILEPEYPESEFKPNCIAGISFPLV